MLDNITLAAGGGGRDMNALLASAVFSAFKSPILLAGGDAAYIQPKGELAFSTDSFVITPEFFPGGNIGKLAAAGTINDIAVSGAIPKYLSCSLVIPEGYSLENLKKIISSLAETAAEAGVEVVTGDTKVVPRGDIRGLIVNTAGIGEVVSRWNDFSRISTGDKVIITSDIARHGMAVLAARGELGFTGAIPTDCAVLSNMLALLHKKTINFARDATRGGVAAVLNEIAVGSGKGIIAVEEQIPIRDDVRELCNVLGFDPLTVANEGAAILIAPPEEAEAVLEILKAHPYGASSAICGEVARERHVLLETSIGGKRRIDFPTGENLPRIC
ncbi:MAG: hydrogenase expression/formation protein HypE [Deferribacteraceae bacterium]|jgi:hydrogenase expression/formation protein HypE|nr:hydrogenase expression/formation protein HypE [Deferribacteraceae bacterium]